jgi:outer membrane autotransporter protein
MIGGIIFRFVTFLLITAILGLSYSSAHAQTQTPQLVFSTYLGGTTPFAAGSNPLTFAQNDACDAHGNIYVTGATQVSDLPVLNAYQPTPAPGSTESAFVAKYNPAGKELWCTYLGGDNQSMGVGVAAMPNGGVVVVGVTTSDASGPFPTLNAFQSQNNGQSDYFMSVFNANGKLTYSTVLGGSGVQGGVLGPNGQIIFYDDSQPGNCVAVDAKGLVYVAGMTTSGNFPVTPNALQSNLAGTRNATLSIINPSKSGAASLVYSSYLGGDHDNQGHSIAVDPSGRDIVEGGFTTSLNFPTTSNAYRSTAPPGGFSPNSSNGFITEFQSSQPGSPSSKYTMVYSTYLGADSSTARDDTYGIALEPSGLIVATGRTQSAGFPMTQAGPTIYNSAPYLHEGVSGDEPYVVTINPSLNGKASLVYSTFLGGGSASGQWGTWATSVAVDARGAVYVGGETNAQGAPYVHSNLTAPQTFPYTSNAFQKAPQGSEDAFLMQISPSGSYLGYSTYLGGTASDRTYGLAVDPAGNVVMSGLTFSQDFPLQNPAQKWPGNTGSQNAFVTEFSPLDTAGDLIIDNGATYPVTAGISNNNDYVGQYSTGTLIQGGFTNTVSNIIELGCYAGSSGTYILSGGSLSAQNEWIGYIGSGSFTQTGGTNTVADSLYLGNIPGASGSYTLSDPGSGSLLWVAGTEYLGFSGSGTFTQTGGSNTVGSNLFVGTQGGTGFYSLGGGSLSVAGGEYIGDGGGSGSFTQSGGTHTVTNGLWLGSDYFGTGTGGTGSYNLSGGSLQVTGPEYIGDSNSGSGSFTQSGGTHTVAALYLGSDSQGTGFPGTGSYNLSGGSLSVAGGEYIGDGGGSGSFTQSGGTHTVATLLEVGGSGTYWLQSGSVTAPTFQVDAGGLLKGSGTIQGNVTNSGTVSPGNSPGTLNVSGDYTQTSSGTLRIEVASPTNYDQLRVTSPPGHGTATLAGTVAPVLLGGYRPLANQVFPGVVTTTGGVSGTFSNVSEPLTLNWQPGYNANTVDLLFQPNYANPALGLTSNGQAVGNMLQGVAWGNPTGDLAGVLNTIDSLGSAAAVADAYKQISPEKAAALATLGFAGATFQMRNLATRTTNLRFVQGEGGGGSALIPGGFNFNYSKLDGLMLAYNGASLSNLFSARKEFPAPEGHWGVYVDGGAAFGSQHSSVNQTGYNFTLGGFTLGADYRLRDNLLVGLATGYSNTSSGFYGSGGSVNVNTVPFNAYVAYFPGSLYAYGSLGYALNLYDLKRGLNFGGLARTASSSTTGNQLNLYGETGYDLELSRFILTPSATLAYSSLWVNGLTETGAGALNLKVGPQSANSVQTGVGGRLTVPLKMGPVNVVPQGYAFYQHEFANGSRGLNASLSQGSSAFNFQTNAAKRNFALVGASVTVGLKKNLYAQVNYNAEVGRGNYTAQWVNAGLRYEF